jgi:putative ATP-binding cassette transporter
VAPEEHAAGGRITLRDFRRLGAVARMRLVLLLLRTARADVLVAIVASVVSGLSAAGIALVLQAAIAARGADLGWHIAAFAACWAGYGLGSVVTAHRVMRVTQRAVRDLRLGLSRQILGLPLPRLERDSARIFPVLTEDIQTIVWAAENFPTALTGAVTIIGCAAVLATISWPLALACGILLGLAFTVYYLPYQRLTAHLGRWRAEWDRISQLIDGLVHGHKELMLDPKKRDALLDRHLAPAVRRQQAEMTRAATWDTLLRRWGEMFLLLGIGALLFTLPWHSLASYEAFARFLFVCLFLLGPLGTVAGFAGHLSRIDIATRRAQELGVTLTEVHGPRVDPSPSVAPVFVPFGLRDAVYRHVGDGGREFSLGPIDLAFDRPEIVFIHGGNGSGKTTLLKLLCGLYPPADGALLVSGARANALLTTAHQQRCAVVFAQPYLFPALLGYETRRDRAPEWLERVSLAHQVQVDAEGRFSTTALSQGQRKRLALVAALLEDKPVYVFDEWAADQDPEFRRAFYDRFLPELRARGRLVIAITHDELYHDRADRLIHVVEGRIASDRRQVAATSAAHGA